MKLDYPIQQLEGGGEVNKEAYYHNLHTYQEYEEAYLTWATWRKQFLKQETREKYGWSKGSTKAQRLKKAKLCVAEFPNITAEELSSLIGGNMKKYNLTKLNEEPFYNIDYEKRQIYRRLSYYPDEIYDAIENVYKWSILIHVRTSHIEEKLPDVIQFIATNCI